MDMDMDMGVQMNSTQPEHPAEASEDSPMSYFAYGKHSSTIMAHIALMTIAWCFLLPVGKTPLFLLLSGQILDYRH